MPARRCTVLNGEIVALDTKSIKLRFSLTLSDALGMRYLWVPRKMIEGGISASIGEKDIVVSNWWLRRRGIYNAVISTITPINTTASQLTSAVVRTTEVRS